MSGILASRRGTLSQRAFSPFDINWAHAFWASDPAWSHPADGNPLTSWRNNTGGGDPVAGAIPPTYHNSVASFNNKPAISFTGENTCALSITGLTPIAPTWSIVTVARFSGARFGSSERIMTVVDGINSGLGHSSGNAYGMTISSSGASIAGADTNAHLIMGRHNPSAPITRIEVDTAAAIGGGVVISLDRIILGNGNTTDRALAGDIAFAGVYVGDIITNPNYLVFKQWAKNFYGLAL